MTQPRVILLVGIPGSGKSSWAAQQDSPILSTDAIRLELSGDETDQSINTRVFAELNTRLNQSISQGNPVTIIDATNLRRQDRAPILKVIKDAGARAEAVVFNVPLDLALQRNQSRPRVVPEEIVKLFHSRLQLPSEDEGFASIISISA